MKPIISYTTDQAIQMFSPEQRGCYADGEANLTHLPYSSGFRYEMNNCLIDKLINDIIWNSIQFNSSVFIIIFACG